MLTGRERHAGGKASWGWAAEGAANVQRYGTLKSECAWWSACQRDSVRVSLSSHSIQNTRSPYATVPWVQFYMHVHMDMRERTLVGPPNYAMSSRQRPTNERFLPPPFRALELD